MIAKQAPHRTGAPSMDGMTRDDDAVVAALHRQEIHDLRIEKLGHRITIISVILPCLVGAILFFAYLDIKDRVFSVQNSGQTEVKIISEDLEAKLNAMNVELAKVKLTLDSSLPDLSRTVDTVEAKFAKLVDAKADKAAMDSELAAVESKLTKVLDQYKETVHIIDRTNKETLGLITRSESDLKERVAGLEKAMNAEDQEISTAVRSVTQEMTRLSEAFSARMETVDALMETARARVETLGKTVSDAELELGILRKDISLMKKLTDDLAETAIDRHTLDSELKSLETRLEARLAATASGQVKAGQKSVKVPAADLKPKAGREQDPDAPAAEAPDRPQPIIENTLTQ